MAAARAALDEQQAAVPGLAALADTLQQAQSALSDAAAQLSALPDQASSADLAATQEQVASQLQRVSAAAQAAAASLQGLPGPGDAATSLASQLPGQLGDLATAQFGGYSLQTLAAVTAGVAALVALSVPRSDNDDGPPSSGGSGGIGGGSGRAGGGGRPDVLPSSWDAEAVAAYYRRRPVEVARRVAEVASQAAAYGAALLADMAAGGRSRGVLGAGWKRVKVRCNEMQWFTESPALSATLPSPQARWMPTRSSVQTKPWVPLSSWAPRTSRWPRP